MKMNELNIQVVHDETQYVKKRLVFNDDNEQKSIDVSVPKRCRIKFSDFCNTCVIKLKDLGYTQDKDKVDNIKLN